MDFDLSKQKLCHLPAEDRTPTTRPPKNIYQNRSQGEKHVIVAYVPKACLGLPIPARTYKNYGGNQGRQKFLFDIFFSPHNCKVSRKQSIKHTCGYVSRTPWSKMNKAKLTQTKIGCVNQCNDVDTFFTRTTSRLHANGEPVFSRAQYCKLPFHENEKVLFHIVPRYLCMKILFGHSAVQQVFCFFPPAHFLYFLATGRSNVPGALGPRFTP